MEGRTVDRDKGPLFTIIGPFLSVASPGFWAVKSWGKKENEGEGVPSCQLKTVLVKNRIPAGLRSWREILGLTLLPAFLWEQEWAILRLLGTFNQPF